MNTMPFSAAVAPAGNYEATRFNTLQHGVLSRYAVLPWEDRSDYQHRVRLRTLAPSAIALAQQDGRRRVSG